MHIEVLTAAMFVNTLKKTPHFPQKLNTELASDPEILLLHHISMQKPVQECSQ